MYYRKIIDFQYDAENFKQEYFAPSAEYQSRYDFQSESKKPHDLAINLTEEDGQTQIHLYTNEAGMLAEGIEKVQDFAIHASTPIEYLYCPYFIEGIYADSCKAKEIALVLVSSIGERLHMQIEDIDEPNIYAGITPRQLAPKLPKYQIYGENAELVYEVKDWFAIAEEAVGILNGIVDWLLNNAETYLLDTSRYTVVEKYE
jgi:hypothetical protein